MALALAALACVLALAALATPALAQTTVPSGWSLTPDGLTAGAQFRLLFLSSTKRNGSVTTIATYNIFIQNLAAAGHTDIQAYSTGFRVVGCTAAVDARDNTSTTGTGVPIYWLDGNKVADTYADFYDGSWDDEANDTNESGTNGPDTSQSGNYPITGCDHDGTESIPSTRSFALGSTEGPQLGRPNSTTTGHGPISSNLQQIPTATRPMYGLSAVFQVGADTTPPTPTYAEIAAAGTQIALGFSEDVQQSNLPPASAITVTADGIAVTVTSVIASALNENLIAVSPLIRQGQAVVVTYTDPTTGDDANAFQDIAGNDAATFTTGMNGVPSVNNGSTVAATAPGAPTGLTATGSGTTTINLSWTAPADNGGRVITGYKIEVSSDSGSTWSDLVANTSSTTTTYAHTGLAGGTTRHYRVSAINTIGTGLPSNIDNATTTNNAPTVANAIPDQSAPVGTAFSYAFPANTFSDADSDALTYTATKADGTALPTWLSFTASTRAFSGTPQAADTGTVSVKVTASDGNGGSVSDEFDITVSAADTTPPTLTSATILAGGQIIELQLSENVQRSNLPPASAFTVTAGGSAVTLSLVLVPAALDTYWISVPSSSVIRQGQVVVVTYTDPTAGNDVRAIQDVAGNDAATFTTGMNSVPAVTNNSTVNTPATGAPTITGTPQVGQTLTAATTAIMDANGLNNVSYTYQWIRVDGSDSDISGARASTYTLVTADQGKTIKVKVSFTDDASNAETLTSVATAVVSAAANTAPTVANTIPDQSATAGTAFSYAFPANTFSDADSDTLSYTATKADGTALPTWLSFTAGTRAFSGTPQAADIARVSVKVTASDGNGGSVSDEFDITVADTTPTAPGAPSGLTATASGTTQINLSWTAPADNGGRVITGYKIEVSSDSGSTWTDRVANTSSSTTTYAHTGLAAGTTRHYRVSAINTVGTGAPSNIDNATTGQTGQTTVTFGASLYTAVEGGAAATVTVELSAAPSAAVTIPLVVTLQGTTTPADYSGIPARVTFTAGQTTVTFTVTATVDGIGDGGESVSIGFGTLPDGVVLGARDTAVVTLSDGSEETFVVSFGSRTVQVRENTSSFRFGVYLGDRYRPGGGNPRQPVTIPLVVSYDGATAADHTAIPASVTFGMGEGISGISMRAIQDQTIETSEKLTIAFAEPLPPGVRLPAEGDCCKTVEVEFVDGLVPRLATVDGTMLVLTYNKVLNSASAPFPSDFTVTVDNTRVAVGQVSAGGSILTLTLATAVEAGQTVTLDYTQGTNRIRDVEGNAAVSFFGWVVTNTHSGDGGGTDPPGRPAAPSVSATAGSGTSLDVTWTAPSNTGPAITSYDLQYRQGTSGNFTDGPQDVTGTSAAIGSLAPGTSYEVQVRATNAEGDGDWSFSGTGQTGASVPPGGGTDPPDDGDGGGGGVAPDDTSPGANDFPTADAGPDQTGVWEGALVTLDGSGSSDPDDDPLRYRWNQLSGEPVVLSSQNVVNPSFTAPQGLTADAVLSFSLLVTDPDGRFDRDTVTITVEQGTSPSVTGGPTYYFPHLAVGEGWQTTITYTNYSTQEVNCQTDFLSDQGTPLMVSFAGRGTVVRRTDVLPPGGSVHQETNVGLSAPLAPGWARGTCSGPLKASLLYRRYNSEGMPVAEAGVNATTVPATRFVTFAEQGEGRFGTGVAYANPSATAALVTFTARDAEGLVLDSFDRTLLPGGHAAQNMAPLFDLPSFTGSLEITSTAPIVTLSLNFEAAPVFSSLPPGELDAAAQGSTTYYFPHLAVGASWQTTITYINYSPQEVTCQTEFLSDHGGPLMVSFADRGTIISRPDVLPPGGSVHQETNVELSAPLAPGWARATCSGPVKANLLFRLHNSEGVPVAEAGVNAATVPATRFVTFAEQGEGKFGTGVAYANPSDTTTAFVTFTVRDADGRVLASVDRTLLPNGHDAQNMAPLFGLSSFAGSLEVTSTEPIVSLSLNFEADPVFSSLPPGELDAAAQ